MKLFERLRYVILGFIIMLFLGSIYSYSIYRIAIEDIFSIGSIASGLPYMTSLFFYSLFMFITGHFIDKFNPRIIMLIGVILVSLGMILSSFASNIIFLTITYGFISGIGVGITYGVPISIAAQWFPERKGLMVGLVLIGFGLSPLFIAPLIEGFVRTYGVMNTFLIQGFVYLIILPFLSFQFKSPNKITIRIVDFNQFIQEVNQSILDLTKKKIFWGIYLNFILGTMIGLMLIGLTTLVGMQMFGYEKSSIPFLIGLFAIFNGLGRPVFGWIVDQFTIKISMLLSYALIVIAALLVIFLYEYRIIFIISFSLFWFNLGAWLAIAPTSSLKVFKEKNSSKNYGLIFTAYGIGAIIGTVLSGSIIDITRNFLYIFYLVIAVSCIGFLIVNALIEDNL